MEENSIRSDSLRSEGRRLYNIDQARLLEKKAEFVEIECPACGQGDPVLFYERDAFLFKECLSCETVFVSPRPTKEMLLDHYRTSLAEKYWNENVYPASEAARIEHLIRPRVRKIIDICRTYGIPTGTLVDVGAGSGMFCEQVIESGVFEEVVAVEPDPSPAQSCRARGFRVVEDFIENIHALRADVVTSIESIEHVFDPVEYVRSINKILPRGGLFVLTTPNIKGFDLLTLKDRSDNTTAPDHLNYFHPASLQLLMDRSGFETLEINTPGQLDAELVRKKVLAGLYSLDDQPFLKRILIDEWETFGKSFQDWIAENGLSSHMWAVARKKTTGRESR